MKKTKLTQPENVQRTDRAPHEERAFQHAYLPFRSLADFYGFQRVHPSIIEESAPFSQLIKAGMLDRGLVPVGRVGKGSLIVTPAQVLSAVRLYATAKMYELPSSVKMSFVGDSFSLLKNEDIQDHSEFGAAVIGEVGPVAEAEILQVFWKYMQEGGYDFSRVQLRLNAIGCKDCRVAFRSPFAAYYRTRGQRMCKDCKKNLKRTPTKVLMCQEEQCKIINSGAPQILDYLCEACKKHLKGILEFLEETKIPYFLDPQLFKEGSWFTRFVFEIIMMPAPVEGEGAVQKKNIRIAEGGRISKAAELLTGKPVEVVAGTFFWDALAAFVTPVVENAVQTEEFTFGKVFLVQLGDLAKRKSLTLIDTLRKGGVEVKESLGNDSIKTQLKVAEKMEVEIALILGQKESLEDTIIVREITTGIQETVPQHKLIDFLKRKFKKAQS